jgi:hypothetical protein
VKASWIGRLFQTSAIAAAVLAVPAVASATIYTPNPADMNDLDHHYVYTWKISGIPTISAGNTVTSAKMTFTNMYNWDNSPNDLFLHLLDTAKNAGVASFVDETSSVVNNLVDDFAVNRYWSDPNWLVANGTADTKLTQRSFSPLGANPTTGDPGPDTNVAGWTWTPSGTLNGSQLYTYTYTFTAAQDAALLAYINNGGNIAIGFDPDCHFFNDGITLDIQTGKIPAVPEPASLLLLGTGLIAARRYRTRRS